MSTRLLSLKQRQGYYQRFGSARSGLQVDWRHPLVQSLAYVRVMDNLHLYPLYSRNPQIESIGGASYIASSKAGFGLDGPLNATTTFQNANNSFGVQQYGTMLIYVTQNWSSTDAKLHYAVLLGQSSGDTTKELHLAKVSDNNWYCGFYNGTVPTDHRVIVAASTIASAGDSYVMGVTWQLGGTTTLYSKGVSRGTHASPANPYDITGTGNTHRWIVDGSIFTANSSFRNGDGSMIHWLAIWDRILDASELALLNQQPYCFLTAAPFAALKSPASGGAAAEYFYNMIGRGGLNV